MREQQPRVHPVDVAVDVAVVLTGTVLGATVGATRRAGAVLEPVAGMVLRPPWLPPRLRAGPWLEARSRHGAARRAALVREVSRRLDVPVLAVVVEMLRRLDLAELLLAYVDLDRVVAGVDLDAAAARLDVPAVLDRIDLDDVVRRVDVAAVVDRVDVEPVVARVDLDAAARRLDVDAVLARLDLTAIVLERVDLDAVLAAILDRLDLVALAAEVIDGVDLPEIIRESTGSMASDTVQGVRMQAIGADEAVGRAVDRFLLRRSGRSTQAPAVPAPRGGHDSRRRGRGRDLPAAPRGAPLPGPARRAGDPHDRRGDRRRGGAAPAARRVRRARGAPPPPRPRGFRFPDVGLVLSLAAAFGVLVVYETLAWWLTGRTYGALVLGLRVVNHAGGRLRFSGAFVRALFTAVFPLGIVWVAVSRGTGRSTTWCCAPR